MEQTLIFSGLPSIPGWKFWRVRLAALCLGTLRSPYLLVLYSIMPSDLGHGSAEYLYALKPKNPI
jgi:hypothetical protein